MRDDAAAALLDALQLLADVVALVRKFLPQHAEHAVPGGERLRTNEIAGDRARSVEGPAHGDIDAEVPARIAAGRAQHRAHLGMRDDAGAAADEADVDALIDVGFPSRAAQQDGREQAAHGAADHQCAPRSSMRSRPTVPCEPILEESCRKCRAVPEMRGCPVPAPPIASPQPYNRPVTAASGGNHGRTPHRQAPLCRGLGRRSRNACHRARICSRRLSLTAGDVGQSIPAGWRRRCCRPSVCGRDGAAAEAAARGRDQSRAPQGRSARSSLPVQSRTAIP